MYGEYTVKQNAKQILCLFSACDHLKGIFLEAQANISPLQNEVSILPQRNSHRAKERTGRSLRCVIRLSRKWAVYMQIHLGVNNGGSQCTCVCVCMHVCAWACVFISGEHRYITVWVLRHCFSLCWQLWCRTEGLWPRAFCCRAAHCFLSTLRHDEQHAKPECRVLQRQVLIMWTP